MTDQYPEAVGFAEVSLRNVVDGCLTSPVGYLEGIFVDPEQRGKGIGRLLLDRASFWFKQQGCTEMATDALIEDEDAQRFHLRMGFEETYRIVEYKKKIVQSK